MPVLLQTHPGVLVCEAATVASSLLAQHLLPQPGRSQVASVASTTDEPTDTRRTAASSDICLDEAEDAQSSSGDALSEQELPEHASSAAEHDQEQGQQDAVMVIPPAPHAAGELRMSALLTELWRPVEPSQPFWRCSRRLGLIEEINYLRGLPGPRAAAMDVRQRNLEMICMHPQWRSLLPWSIGTLCKAIADGQHDLTFPLTVDGRRELVPLSTLYSLQPMQAFTACLAGLPEAVRASEGGRNRQAVQMIERILPDISLLGILHYNRFPKQVLASLAEQARSLSAPQHFALWDTVKTAAALRVEVDLSMVMRLIHSVLTPFQTACFVSASLPLICDWIALAKQLVAEPLPPSRCNLHSTISFL